MADDVLYEVAARFAISLNPSEAEAAGLTDRLDPDGMVRFGPGEMIPSALEPHWWIQAQIALGAITVVDEAPATVTVSSDAETAATTSTESA